MATYGYVRHDIPCPTVAQFTALSEYECQEIFLETGDAKEDPELQRLLRQIQPGDTVVITHLSVLCKTLLHLSVFLETLKECGARFVSIEDQIDSELANSFYHYMELLTENDRATKRLLIRQSLEVSRSNGIKLGRPVLAEETVQKVQQLYSERKTLREIAAACDISLGSAHKYVLELKQKATHSVSEGTV